MWQIARALDRAQVRPIVIAAVRSNKPIIEDLKMAHAKRKKSDL